MNMLTSQQVTFFFTFIHNTGSEFESRRKQFGFGLLNNSDFVALFLHIYKLLKNIPDSFCTSKLYIIHIFMILFSGRKICE